MAIAETNTASTSTEALMFESHQTVCEDFWDDTVIVTTFDDARLATVSDASCRYEQSFDSARFLVIRPTASDEQLSKAAALFNLPLEALAKFRSTHSR